VSFEFITTLVTKRKEKKKRRGWWVWSLSLFSMSLQNGNNDDNVFLKSFSLSFVY